VLVVFLVVVAVSSFLFFGYYLPRLTSPASPTSPPALTTQETSGATTTTLETGTKATEERTRPRSS
jgi:hypothetical protein